METTSLQSLSDDELLHRLSDLVPESRCVEADLVAHIGEVDDRRLYAGKACSPGYRPIAAIGACRFVVLASTKPRTTTPHASG